MYLFFDTETTGIPLNYNAPLSDSNNWPRLVQLAFIHHDDEGNLLHEASYIIKPNGFTIPDDAISIHKITNEFAQANGTELEIALREFSKFVNLSETIVAHNVSFDEKIVGAELLRVEMENVLIGKKKICTMTSSTEFCAIETPRGFKWPKLSELYFELFQENFDEAHNATHDIRATAKCFWELKSMGII